MTSVIDMTAEELRQLRYRLGWSQAELARLLNIEMAQISGLESGALAIPHALKSSLVRIMFQADSNALAVQRRPIAEVIMKEKNLSQLHDFDCQFEVVASAPTKL